MTPTQLKEGAALQLLTRLGEDVLALELANKTLENSSMMLQMPGLVRTYEMIAAELAALTNELSKTIETV